MYVDVCPRHVVHRNHRVMPDYVTTSTVSVSLENWRRNSELFVAFTTMPFSTVYQLRLMSEPFYRRTVSKSVTSLRKKKWSLDVDSSRKGIRAELFRIHKLGRFILTDEVTAFAFYFPLNFVKRSLQWNEFQSPTSVCVWDITNRLTWCAKSFICYPFSQFVSHIKFVA